MRVALETGCIRLPVSYHDVFVWETKLRNFLDFPFKGSFRVRESASESENDLRIKRQTSKEIFVIVFVWCEYALRCLTLIRVLY